MVLLIFSRSPSFTKGLTTCSFCKMQPDCSFAAEMPGSPIIDALERNQSMNVDLSSISETHLPHISVCAHHMIALATAYETRMSLGPMMGYARILSGGMGADRGKRTMYAQCETWKTASSCVDLVFSIGSSSCGLYLLLRFTSIPQLRFNFQPSEHRE